ncbi:hypothetical protein FVEN_g12905 [Fusarium venenatum]|uniref:Uncharacterized protein n=1 Tax=Fusarium venenatum TaxID=56646 RepID=A0A2L2TCY2_9HYPO|nr:uncharacterized protein FVRRES_08025 [Fusarium venenatum]KAG8354461.1 hypothetical protein FVEN_g12905 [Fusarium venenatum]CEI67948.1 unnamed protein product [Fusarium venenatum]
MSSNNSLPNLTDIVTRKCDIRRIPSKLPSLGDDVPTAWIPLHNDSYGGMTEICYPNMVNVYRCTLWCELPTTFVAGYEKSGSKSFDNYFIRQLEDTGMNMSQVWTYSAKETSAASVPGRPLSIMGIGTLALAVFIAVSI